MTEQNVNNAETEKFERLLSTYTHEMKYALNVAQNIGYSESTRASLAQVASGFADAIQALVAVETFRQRQAVTVNNVQSVNNPDYNHSL